MTRRVVTPGLAPSASLAPSATLAPMDTIYGGAPITPHQFWMTTGAGGNTLENQSAYVEFGEGVSYNYGRSTQFDDVSPGTFTFTLNNSDGRFTPDNSTSPLTTKVTEGMVVMWVLGTRIVRGQILSVEIPADEATWHQLVVTCDDMLGTAGRHAITTIPDALLDIAAADLEWLLNEDDGAAYSPELHSDPIGAFNLFRSNPASTAGGITYGVEQVVGLPGTAVTLAAANGETNWYGTRHGNTSLTTAKLSAALPNAGATTDLGFWNLWVYPHSTINFAVTPKFATDYTGYTWSAQIQVTPSTVALKLGDTTAGTYTMSGAQQQAPHYLSMQLREVWQTSGSYWAMFGYLYVDGVVVASGPWHDPQHSYTIPQYIGSVSPVEVSLAVTDTTNTTTGLSGTVERVSRTTNGGGREYLALPATLDARRNVLDQVAPEINTAVYNGPLTTAPTGLPDLSGSTLLDLFNEIARTEAGHLFVQTNGVIGASTTYVEFRARDRPQTPESVYDVSADGSGLPSFVRDITNLAESVDVSGPLDTITVTDPTITGRYVTTGVGETVLYTQDTDLTSWGQDRLYRGKNRAVRAQTFTVDAASTPVDRSTDLLNLVPGDRIQLTNVPATRLGFNTWDGYVLGASETHTPNSNSFTFNLAPVTPNPALADASLFAAGGDITLLNAYTPTDTNLAVVASPTTLNMSSTTPYTILIDSEQMTVTAVTGSTITVTRGVNGTTARSHTVNAAVEIVPTALYAY